MTCEAAATASAARTSGWLDLDEERINQAIFSNLNPRIGFAGNPDGWQTASYDQLRLDSSAGYGAEAPALQLALVYLHIPSQIVENGEFGQTITYLHAMRAQGFGVVIWGTTRPWLVHARSLAPYRLVEGEHAYEFLEAHTSGGGPVDGALVGDPLSGTVYIMPIVEVQQMMALFDNMALVISPPGRILPAKPW